MKGRLLAVDPGEKNIGLAVSDPLGISANPLMVLTHVSKDEDARRIAIVAREQQVTAIVIGLPLEADGEIGPAAKRSQKLAGHLRKFYDGEIIFWDESGSTNAVQELLIEMNVPRQKRKGHQDARAAAWILQDYLNHQANTPSAESH
ncbi:MAG: Holliday junction resolvase RuvX [Chloroflexi bacterium]|nr:Holliday junction resolvase RuvX [Chloroflexota bacterium]